MQHVGWLLSAFVCGAAAAVPPGTRVFVNEQNANQIWELDPATGDIIGQVPSPALEYMDDMSFYNEHLLWVVTKNHDNGNIALLDIDTGQRVYTLNPDRPGNYVMEGLAWAEGQLWVSYYNNMGGPDMIQRIDWRFGQVLQEFDAPGYVAQGLVMRDGYLYHSDWGGRAIYKLDPSDGHIVEAFTNLPFSPKGMDLVGDVIWVTDPGPNPANPVSRVWWFDPDARTWGTVWDRTYTGRLDGLAIWVPEPHAASLLACGAFLLAKRRRSKRRGAPDKIRGR